MSFLDRLKGVFVETEDAEVADLPASLSTADAAPASSRLVGASPTGRLVNQPTPARVEELVVPAEIKAVVDSQFNAAAAPALTAWMDLNADMAADIPEAIARARVVIKSIARMGHTPEAVLIDIDEARTALTGLRHEVEKAKDAEVAEKAIAKEKQAEAARTRIQELEAEIQQLASQASSLDNEALAARSAIDRDQLATIRYIDNISRSLDGTAREVRSINPQPARAA